MNIRKIIVFSGIVIFLFFIYISVELFLYRQYIKSCEIYAKDCLRGEKFYPDCLNCSSDEDKQIGNPVKYKNSCYCIMYNLLLPRLLVYKVTSNNKKLNFIKPCRYTQYIVPTLALEKADVFLGYGIWNDICFESMTSVLFNKKTYSYDCGVEKINTGTPLVSFESECIGTDKFILTEENQVSSGKIHTFGQKIKDLKLENKKYFIKMDIAGAETEVFSDILKHSDNITGISFVLRCNNPAKIAKSVEMLRQIEKDFILVYRNILSVENYMHCKCKYSDSHFSKPISLTYINKKLVDKKYYLPFKQDFSEPDGYSSVGKVKTFIPSYTINWRIVLYEKIKIALQKFNGKKK